MGQQLALPSRRTRGCRKCRRRPVFREPDKRQAFDLGLSCSGPARGVHSKLACLGRFSVEINRDMAFPPMSTIRLLYPKVSCLEPIGGPLASPCSANEVARRSAFPGPPSRQLSAARHPCLTSRSSASRFGRDPPGDASISSPIPPSTVSSRYHPPPLLQL